MTQDVPTGFGSYHMKFGAFGATSTAVDGFDNTTDMSTPLVMEHRVYFDFFPSETTPGISTDESMSPSSHTGSLFGFPDMNIYDTVFFDSHSVSLPNPILEAAPGSSRIPDVEISNNNFQPYVARTEFPLDVQTY